jgi:hypothetical protein
MHASVHKKMTKYLCTTKSTKYNVVKKKNRRIKLLRTYIALILVNTKIYSMHKCSKNY